MSASRRWEITVLCDVQSTSDNVMRRLHWREVHRRRKAARLAGFVGWSRAGRPTVAEKVRVSILVRRGVRLDPQNIVGALKPVFDGVFVGWEEKPKGNHLPARLPGMLPDDSAEWLEIGQVAQETGKRWKGREEVVLTVEELPAVSVAGGEE